jgi:hypothetical protein
MVRSSSLTAPVSEGTRTTSAGLAALEIAVDVVDGVGQLGDALHGGVALGKRPEIVDQPGDGDLHLQEGAGELGHLPERELARQVFGRCQQQRQDRHEDAAAIGQPGDVAVAAHDAQPALDEILVGGAERPPLVRLAADQRDTLGILAQPRQLETQLGLRFVAAGDGARQPAADPQHEG